MRTKDLVDLVLMIETDAVTPEQVAEAVRRTFARRRAHAVPDVLAEPPKRWEADFDSLATEANLKARDLASAFRLLSEFWQQAQN
jgi:hypothetical protein